ncbi:WDR27 protein, partial [Amia calva]|nr:WDR27 protein [Amia calva]
RFPKPIGAAQFYYMDKFLLLACGPSVQLYLYHLDAQRDDLKRLQQKSRCRLAGKLQMTSAAEITCLSAANAFFSYVVLACGSDRSVEVFDLNAGCRAAGIPDVHTRAAHHVSQNQGSVFSTQGPDAYNLFLTSAMTDAIKLWDLRTLR